MNTVTPDSTTAALAAAVPLEKKNEEVPGTFPETPSAGLDGAGDFGVNPLPAAAGAVNPIKLAPGEKIPQGLTANGTTDQVKLDPESYEKSDTIPGKLHYCFSPNLNPVSNSRRWLAPYPELCRTVVYNCCFGGERTPRAKGS